MKTIFCHKVSIYQKPAKIWDEDCFTVTKEQVLAENEIYIVLNDSHFTKLKKTGYGVYFNKMEKETISVRTNDNLLGNGVFYTFYSTTKRRPSTIKKHIEAYVKEKFGWLSEGMDLSIIKQGTRK